MVFIGSYSQETGDPVVNTRRKLIEYIKCADKHAIKTQMIFLTFDEHSKISATDRENAKSENIALVGTEFPLGCPEQPNLSVFDVYATSFYQKFLNSNLSTDVTHIIGHSPYSGNAMLNIATAIENRHQYKPKTLVVCSSETRDRNTKECLKIADGILCTDNAIAMKEFLDQDLPQIYALNLTTKHTDNQSKDEPDAKAGGENDTQEDAVYNPEMTFLNTIYGKNL